MPQPHHPKPQTPQNPQKPQRALKPLRPIRTPASERLDNQEIRRRGGQVVKVPPARPWTEVYQTLARQWHVGEHFAFVGKAGSGKTTAAREILMLRDWVVVLGTKARDPDLYQAFQRQGYVIKHTWEPTDTKNNRVIFAPPLPSPTSEGRAAQANAFRKVLIQMFQLDKGNWTLYCDELRYLTHDLKLQTEIDTLYLQGRSLGVTIVASTQRPRSVPLNMFEQATWFGFFRIPDREDRARASEMLGSQRYMADETMSILPPHEMLLVNTKTDSAWRTKVYTG